MKRLTLSSVSTKQKGRRENAERGGRLGEGLNSKAGH